MSKYDTGKPVVQPSRKGFALDHQRGKVFGVCGGIANYFGIDPLIVRVGFAAGTIIGFGSLILVYLAIALIAD
ncbi:PspC domain-containing protein [Tsuneonella mangrovi]|uniref:PspC domain-containing protein n=1 Tax=Tsuneonella mangrovi TaxID=1982042 RepID=UPI000BA20238|nr:PspC domain-containing protein [Tsuneonella mangrovi]